MMTQDQTRKKERLAQKLAQAMQLPNEIKVSFWSQTPLMSPRMAKIMSDPETREIFMRAVRSTGSTE